MSKVVGVGLETANSFCGILKSQVEDAETVEKL